MRDSKPEDLQYIDQLRAIIKALQMDNAQLHSDIVNANMNLDHVCDLLKTEEGKVANAKKKLIKVSKKLQTAKAENEELVYKLECLLCHATGGKLSKHTYHLDTMYSAVNDEVQDCCDEAKADAIKEFAERLKEKIRDVAKIEFQNDYYYLICEPFIDNIVEEMVGDKND